jgi:cyclophilin family peptidyl-prolyl cis-trans isomerase
MKPSRHPAWLAWLGLALVVSVLAWAPASSASEPQKGDPSRLSRERVVFHTIGGDLVFALYPEAAPKTVQQFLTLVRGGVYDTTSFVRIQPGFIAQTSNAFDRTEPLTPEQAELVRTLPGEFSAVPHEKGALVMARDENDADSAETSFSILLGPARHLDGQYTIFGRLVAGEAVLDEMAKVQREPDDRPVERLTIRSAVVVASEQALANIDLEAAHTIPVVQRPLSTELEPSQPLPVPILSSVAPSLRPGSMESGGATSSPRAPLAGGLAFLMALGIANALLGGRVRPAIHGSLNLAMLLVVMFLLLVLLTPAGHERPVLASLLCFGLLGVLKALGRFERAPNLPAKTV